MMRPALFLLTFFMLCNGAYGAHLYSEKTYQEQWCKAKGGQLEYKLNDKTRVDCLTNQYAVEFDFAPKWHECIGQALYYAEKTGKQATCVLIMERGERDLKYLKRLRNVAYKKGIKTFTMKTEHIICNSDINANCK